MRAETCAERLQKEIARIYIVIEEKIRLMAVFSGGHVLLEDLPGSAKTTLIKTMSRALGCDFKRIQCTPDLMPSDIIGLTVYDRESGGFRQVRGPVFTNILLADEINRAIPRTQSALLEAMEEQQVTIDNATYPLPEPLFVMATQNPVERESTFELPAAQMDRFFLKLTLGFPDRAEEVRMLTELGDTIDFSVVNSRCLYQGSKSWAAIHGRSYVTPEDVQAIFLPVLCHRVVLGNEARYTKKTGTEILSGILEETPVPPQKERMFHENGGK